MKKMEWELKDSANNKVKEDFTNHLNGTFSAQIFLGDLPSMDPDWTWKGKIEDFGRIKFQVTDSITVSAALHAGSEMIDGPGHADPLTPDVLQSVVEEAIGR